MGIVSPIGNTLEETTRALKEGRSGIVNISDQLHPDIPSKVGGSVKNLPIDQYVPAREQRRMERFVQLGMVAGLQAWQQSGLTLDQLPDRASNVGVYTGIGMGGIPELCRQEDLLRQSGPRRVSPLLIPMIIPNILNAFLSMRLGLKGPGFTVVSACASSAHALGEAFVKIRDGYADVILAGGSEAVFCDLTFSGFCNMKALSTGFNDQPTRASRPFEKNRDGFVMAEGAAFVVVESESFLHARRGKPTAEIVGYGASSDAYHITQPAPEGEGGERAMRQAFLDAEVPVTDVTYVNAHGTSTPVGDELELQAISRVMGSHAKNVMVSSTKSLTGHMLGAAGAAEVIYSVLAMNHHFLPPNLNLEDPIDSYGLQLIGTRVVEKPIQTFLSNSFGFGGTNASLIVRKVT